MLGRSDRPARVLDGDRLESSSGSTRSPYGPWVAWFGRLRPTPSTPVADGPVPSTPTERVAAVKVVLLELRIGGAAAQGVPLPVRGAFDDVTRIIAHYLPDPDERRALCRQLAEDLQSMVIVDAVHTEEVLDVLGATPARLAEHAAPPRRWAVVRHRPDAALGLAREARLGEGDLLDRWARDDGFVLEMLAVLLVVFTRLAV